MKMKTLVILQVSDCNLFLCPEMYRIESVRSYKVACRWEAFRLVRGGKEGNGVGSTAGYELQLCFVSRNMFNRIGEVIQVGMLVGGVSTRYSV